MQPVFAYLAGSYPPRGKFPQFGDDVLQETLSISEGARQSLTRKKEAMSDFHSENLQHHGLRPREAPLEEPGVQDFPYHLGQDEDVAPAPINLQGGVPSNAPPGAIYYGGDDLPYTTPDTQMSQPRGSVQEGLQPPGLGSGEAPLRARESFRTTQAPGGLDTPATPAYTPIPQNMETDNVQQKRSQNTGMDREVKYRPSGPEVPEVKPAPMLTDNVQQKRAQYTAMDRKVKLKPESKVKQEASHRGPGSSSSAAPVVATTAPTVATAAPVVPDDDVQVTGLKFNNNEDMKFWEEKASANEMRSQLYLRFPQIVGELKYKDRPYLISEIRGLIRQNQWVLDTSEPARARSRSPRPTQARNARDDDDDVEVSGVTWDQNTDPAYWNEQAASYIRQQLAAKFPNNRTEFSFLEGRQEYIDYILKKIREGNYP